MKLMSPALAFILASISLHAQQAAGPSGQAGVGISTDGVSVQYAASTAIQLGLGLNVESTTSEGSTVAVIRATPYVRLLHEGFVTPFAEAAMSYAHSTSSGLPFDAAGSATSLSLAIGLAYYLEGTLGVTLSTRLVEFEVDPLPTATTLGFFDPRAGIEWWFGR